MTKKTITRRELIKLAGTVSAFGAALGFVPRKGNSGQQPGIKSSSYMKIELKLYKENILLYTHELPRNISAHFVAGNRLEFKFFRSGLQLPNSWSWGENR